MYKKIIKKYYLYKIFMLALPRFSLLNQACHFLCKYLIKRTPYGNLLIFLLDIKRLLNIVLNYGMKKQYIFVCSNKIYYMNNFSKSNNILSYLNFTNLNIFNLQGLFPSESVVIWYNMNYNHKLLSFWKSKKALSIGFINFNNFPNITDYIILLESRFFSSVFLFHFFFKQLISSYDKK